MPDKATSLLNGFQEKTQLINFYTESRLALGDQVFNRTLVGEDGWLNLTQGNTLTDHQHIPPFSDMELQNMQQSLEDLQAQVEANGGVFLLVIAPDKHSIYPEHVPDALPHRDGSSRLDQFLNHLADNGSPVHVLDLRPTLLKAKKKYLVYYATDSHWNSIGAFFAYQSIIDELKSSFPNLSSHPITDYKITENDPTPKDMPKIIGSTSLSEAAYIFSPRFKKQARQNIIETPTETGVQFLYFSQTANPEAPTVLVFSDSFFHALRPFLFEHFSRAIEIQTLATTKTPLLTWCKLFPADIVIFELAERQVYKVPSIIHH
jgi:hypothetical protein